MNPYYQALNSLCIYQGVFHNSIGVALEEVLAAPDAPRAYGKLFYALADKQQSWQDYLVTQILQDANPFSRQAEKKPLEELNPNLIAAVAHDLEQLQILYHWQGAHLYDFSWPAENTLDNFLHQPRPWRGYLGDLARYYHQQGVGIFAQYRAFTWQAGELKGIKHPDPIKLGELVGYTAQKQVLQQNTAALLAGYPALNVLLYGSRGTGKSSLVKALLNEYSSQGLRLVEVGKAHLQDLPKILELLREQPQKFLIFVDDLSFEEDDDTFKALKVVLCGSVTAKAANVLVYATSNRRHLVREFFAERPHPQNAEEIHSWDTVQEKLSFSDRFGLTLTFTPADQDTYLEIVKHLATLEGLTLDRAELEFQAKQWATQHNGHSGRTARQFIDFLGQYLRQREKKEGAKSQEGFCRKLRMKRNTVSTKAHVRHPTSPFAHFQKRPRNKAD
jgi:predicted AAA+ superfamily ATPase